MKIVVAIDSFKGSLGADEARRIVAATVSEHLPSAEIIEKPMADGGEGIARAMIAACGGKWMPQKVMGSLTGISSSTATGSTNSVFPPLSA